MRDLICIVFWASKTAERAGPTSNFLRPLRPATDAASGLPGPGCPPPYPSCPEVIRPDSCGSGSIVMLTAATLLGGGHVAAGVLITNGGEEAACGICLPMRALAQGPALRFPQVHWTT